MTGILEQMQAQIVALKEGFVTLQQQVQALNAGGSNVATPAAANPFAATVSTGPGVGGASNPFATPAPAPEPAANPFASTGERVRSTSVTADQITALIQPYIDNDQIKAAFGAAMKGLGIDALPNTPPEKYAPLYTAFQTVIQQAKDAGLIGGAGAAGASII